MKIEYFPETDSLYIDFANRPSSRSEEISEGVVLDYDENGNVVGIDIDQARAKLDLKTLNLKKLPLDVQEISA